MFSSLLYTFFSSFSIYNNFYNKISIKSINFGLHSMTYHDFENRCLLL